MVAGWLAMIFSSGTGSHVERVRCIFSPHEVVVFPGDEEIKRKSEFYQRMETFVTPRLFRALMGHDLPTGEDGMEHLWNTEMQEFCWRLAARLDMPELRHAVIYVDADLARPTWDELERYGQDVRVRLWLTDAEMDEPLMKKVEAAACVREVYLHVRGRMNPRKMEWLRGMKSLHELDVGRTEWIGDAELACLAELTELRRLNLQFSRAFTDEGLSHLKKLVKMRDLDIRGDANASCDEPMEVTWKGMKALRGMTELERLAFCGVWSLGAGEPASRYKNLVKLLEKMPLLEEINLDYGSYQAPDLSVLAELPNLRELCLRGWNLNGKFGMREVKKLKQITSLDLCEAELLLVEQLRHLAEMTQLQTLKLQKSCSLRYPQMQCIGRLKNLRHLEMTARMVALNENLSPLENLRQLRHLKIDNYQPSDGKSWGFLRHLRKMEVLDLNDCTGMTARQV